LSEKDELVVYQDRLWREMHQIIQEKNERIEELFARCTTANPRPRDESEIQVLRNEVRRMGHRNQELEKALREALEMEDDIGEDHMDVGSSSAMILNNFGDVTK
jgi:predicted RNase H-like nuclease (RuvC/YqgF family)